jgi:GNAT superfamily N-acetyltransferase
MADGVLIRELRREDAPAVAALHLEVNPDQLETPERVWFWASRGLEREQWRQWVAELDGEIVGSAWANFEWSVPTPGKGRFWIAVPPPLRGRGIGSALFEQVDAYLRGRGAWRMRSQVDGDPAGDRFLVARGFERVDVDRVSQLDLAGAALEEPRVPPGYRLVPLAQARDRFEDLYAICAAGEIDMPGDEPETAMTLDDWKLDDFGVPDLSDDGSFVALHGEQAVSLAFLCLDPERRLAYNQMTATLPEFKRRGLALAVKLASARWAQDAGYERILTENDETNVGMLAINERLGYRFLYDQVKWALEWERAPAEGGQHL